MPIPALALAWRYRRIIGIALIVLGLLWLVRREVVQYGDGRAAEVQARWDADELAEKAVADAATLKNQLEDAADEARNTQVAAQYESRVAAATADNARLARLLRQATASAGASRAAQGPDQPGAAPTGPQGSDEPPAAGLGIEQLIADALTEARQNADQLDAVLAELTPQM